jgi:hypothetical protein
MKRQAAWVALAAVGFAVGGCGPAKELPNADDLPAVQGLGDKAAAVPKESEPAAKEYVEKAVKAYTAGKPDLAAKGKASRTALKGTMAFQLDGQQTPLTSARQIHAVWPDRFYVGNEVDFRGQMKTVRTWLSGGQLTVHEGGREQDIGGRAEFVRAMRADFVGQHWMALLLPLLEPKAVVFDLRTTDVMSQETGQPTPVRAVKLALPEYPVYTLAFDARTDLLVRVEYATTEQGVPLRKQWSVGAHKAGPDGLMLPAKTECRHNGQTVEAWELEKWEFPAAIPDDEFGPKK